VPCGGADGAEGGVDVAVEPAGGGGSHTHVRACAHMHTHASTRKARGDVSTDAECGRLRRGWLVMAC
jgi:hypothetical protein